jgi:hypothetical protein
MVSYFFRLSVYSGNEGRGVLQKRADNLGRLGLFPMFPWMKFESLVRYGM